jgi:hypothetical protein
MYYLFINKYIISFSNPRLYLVVRFSLRLQSVSTTTQIVCSGQFYEIKFISNLPRLCGLLLVSLFSPSIT